MRATVDIGDCSGAARMLVAREYDGPPWFRAVAVPCVLHGERAIIQSETASHLGLREGDAISVLPVA